jgi:hypothetical protein
MRVFSRSTLLASVTFRSTLTITSIYFIEFCARVHRHASYNAIMGFLGIIEDKRLAHVPATVVLSEEQNPLTVAEETLAPVGLKRGVGKDADIILIPQP